MTTLSPGHTSAPTGDTDVVGARALAQLVDGIVSTIVFGLVAGGVAVLLGGLTATLHSPLMVFASVAPVALLVGSIAGGAIPIVLEWAWGGKTIGKHLVGIRVVSVDGEQVGLGAALARNVFAGIDAAFFYLVGLASISMSPERQRVGDRIAGTVVVRA